MRTRKFLGFPGVSRFSTSPLKALYYLPQNNTLGYRLKNLVVSFNICILTGIYLGWHCCMWVLNRFILLSHWLELWSFLAVHPGAKRHFLQSPKPSISKSDYLSFQISLIVFTIVGNPPQNTSAFRPVLKTNDAFLPLDFCLRILSLSTSESL